jgi:hypothetical protein
MPKVIVLLAGMSACWCRVVKKKVEEFPKRACHNFSNPPQHPNGLQIQSLIRRCKPIVSDLAAAHVHRGYRDHHSIATSIPSSHKNRNFAA